LRQRSLYGEAYRTRSEITAKDLLLRTGIVMQRERDVVQAQLRRNGVQLVTGTARFEDPHRVVVEEGDHSEILSGEVIVIAVGSSPGVPPGIEVDHTTVLTSDDI